MKAHIFLKLVICFLLVLVLGCCNEQNQNNNSLAQKIFLIFSKPSNQIIIGNKKVKARKLYRAVYDRNIDELESLLLNGSDPNFCIGDNSGWLESTPLNVVSRSFYNTWYRKIINDDFPVPELDIVILKLLIDYGADINNRPYIWNRIVIHSNDDLLDTIETAKKRKNKDITDNEIEAVKKDFMWDCNRLIKAFLEAGADPDLLGHPYPFSYDAMKAGITDEEAQEYFKNGTRAINEAIEKGIEWESQVDLLLEYTTLDEESLKAAERSEDPLMIEKINKLWAE